MKPRRVTIVASELLGRPGTGGAGTADSFLAVALGRNGHEVRLLVATGREIGRLDAEWTGIYDSAGVEVRVLEPLSGIRPSYLRPPLEVLHALRDDPPDVLIVNDWRALGYAAMRARQLGASLESTACIVHCHGPARVLAEFARKVPDTLARFGEQVAERASIELADAVVSPSRWLLDWMRVHGWPLPEAASVIPYLREPAALDRPSPPSPGVAPIRRLAFFGQLREGKGIRIYLDALNALEPALLDGVELLFLGRETPRWTQGAIESSLAPATRERLGALRLEANLDRERALDELRRPGTLALMPSLLDNSPNTVSECIENGIPFLSTRVGGIPELVAAEDRDRVLCDPNATDLAAALGRALAAPEGFVPARSGTDPAESLQRWLELVESIAPSERSHSGPRVRVDVVATSQAPAECARRIAARSREAEVQVVQAESRSAALEGASSDWIVFLDEEDLPDDEMLDRLVTAQRASEADAVTCAVRAGSTVQLFLGDPGSLGLVQNQYGVIGLVRRSLVTPETSLEGAADPDWVLLARLALSGARVVSIPEPLASHRGKPGAVTDVPGDGLAVLEAFEAATGDRLQDLPQLAATVAAALARAQDDSVLPLPARRTVRRVLQVLREDGATAFLRRLRARA